MIGNLQLWEKVQDSKLQITRKNGLFSPENITVDE
jgi:hypothetical protein